MGLDGGLQDPTGQMPTPQIVQQLGMLSEWLRVATQAERVREGLTRRVPEFASGQLGLVGGRVQHLKYKDEKLHWVGTYVLTIEGPAPGQRRVVALQGTLIPPGQPEPECSAIGIAFGADAWRCYVPELRMEFQMAPPEKTLPAVPLLTDPQAARALLEQSLRARAPAYQDLRLQGCTPEVLHDHPGRRCTIRYRLEYPEDLVSVAASHGWPEMVIGKTYSRNKGQIAYDGMRALWDSPLARGDIVSIAEPLAYLPDPKMLVQGPLRGELTLKELIKSALTSGTPVEMETLADYVRKTAAGAAALHQSGVCDGEPITWQDTLTDIREEASQLAPAAPAFAAAALALLAHLETQATARPAGPLLPAHGDLKPAKVLVCEGQIGFVDFDTFCLAEPALDLAQFCATVKSTGLSGALSEEDEGEVGTSLPDREACLARLAQLEPLCEAFLATYQALHPVSRQRIWLWEALELLSKVLHGWRKVNPDRVYLRMLLLERHLEGLLRAVPPGAQSSQPGGA